MKKILAILLAAALVFAFAACNKNDDAVETAPSTTNAFDIFEAGLDENPENESNADSDTPSDATGEDATGESAEDATPIPTTVEDILALYNSAINSAYEAEAGFLKERSTDNEKIEGGGAIFSAAKDLIYKFMGVGVENTYSIEVEKGEWESESNMHYLRKSTLTADDIIEASCVENNGQYLIVLEVEDGSSRGSKESQTTDAPIDKCGICVGDEDKDYYDHKTAEVIYDAIAGTYAGADIKESYSNATVKALIDVETGKVTNLMVEFDLDVDIDITVADGTATATTHIYYRDIEY